MIAFVATNVVAQTKGFNRDPEKFIVDLEEYLKSAKEPEVKKNFEVFKAYWKNNKYTEDQQSVIIRMFENMDIAKMTAYPEFNLMLSTLNAAKDTTKGIGEKETNDWLKHQSKLIDRDRQAFLSILETSNHLFLNNRLYVDDKKWWGVSATDYKINYDGKKTTIEFKNIDLTCQGPEDKIRIRETSGIYHVVDQIWKGNGGIVDWERVGLDPNAVFVELSQYEIKLEERGFEANPVAFQYVGMIDGKVQGKFEDKLSMEVTGKREEKEIKTSYPRFESFSDNLTLKGFADGDIIFRGGFGLNGKRMVGKGTKENYAVFEFYRGDRLIVEVKSESFGIDEERIVSDECEATINTDSGTIYHQHIKFNFDNKDKVLRLVREGQGLQESPFFDTDHNMEIWVDQVIWKMSESTISFDMINGEEVARFESKNFYKEYNYELITKSNNMAYHPLDKLYKFYVDNKGKRKTLTLQEYANFVGTKKEYLMYQIVDLTKYGFIFYDANKEMITIKEKAINYFLDNRHLQDYDVIRLRSKQPGSKPNAVLNLVNYDFELTGVEKFQFSDSQYVYAFPREQKVVLKNDRRMIFNGRVTAGRFDLFGDNFDFSYEFFTISSNKIDSLKIWFPDKENDNFLRPIKSVLSDINGTLYIDKPGNKSGLTEYPEYPMFTSRAPSVVAYDKKSIHNGAYKKEEFRFEVDPFTIDSMDNFTIDGLRFPGTFVSGGILPEFPYELGIMDDYSLGFKRKNPAGGYPMYGGKGHGDIDISLSEEGFWATGEIQYEGGIMTSNKILMTPDSTNAEVDLYEIKKSGKYPKLYAADVTTHWLPKEDKMQIYTKDHDVDVFDNGQVFKGLLTHSPTDLSGFGELRWDNAVLTSKDMHFTPIHANADTSAIRIGDIDAGKISFVSTNVKSHIDFQKRTGDFRANELGHLTDFPYNQFASSMDEYKWDMDKKTILLTPTGRQKPEDYFFVSKNPEQKNLKFQSTKALFDMNEGIIYAEEVPYIDIADSRVFPNEGKVTIEKDGVIRPLHKSKMWANRKDKFHEFYDCSIWVEGRLSLSGRGYLEYKDKHSTGQVIYFDKMRVLRDTSTVMAEGYLSDSLNFILSPKIAYKGIVEMYSKQQHLSFKGFVKPIHSFDDIKSDWFKYIAAPDPKDVIVNARDPRNKDKGKVSVGLNYSNYDSINIYTTFFSYRSAVADLEIAVDTGILFYDETENQFVVGDSNYLMNGYYKGNYITFADNKEITAHGILDLGLNMHPLYNTTFIGQAQKSASDSTYMFTTTALMSMALPKECYDRMYKLIEEKASDAPSFSADNETYKENLGQVLDEKDFGKVKDELSSVGETKLVKAIDKDFIISEMSFSYNDSLRGFVGIDPINIAVISGHQVNKTFNARMLIERKRTINKVTFYFEVTKYDYFYFEFFRGSLYIYSTDQEFNTLLKQKAKKINDKGYKIRPASPSKVRKLLDSIDAYTG
ncbi:MAG: hypothetical protein H6607_04350 [Flavobacteriales bacterium]|nr:hypothetical protein [Flavobacteriales bacterium]